MKIDLGFLKIPFEGPFNFALAIAGILWGCLWVTIVFNLVDIKGPAVYAANGPALVDACGKAMVATSLWSLMYYNYIGIQVLSIFSIAVFEMFTKDDVTEKFQANASRYSGNMFEQSVLFLTLLWGYTLLVDYETGGALGLLYVIVRGTYPFYYMVGGKFTFWFESCTQVGYGVNGVFMLGIFLNGLGGGAKWPDFARDNQILAGILGFFVGSLAPFPGLPLTPLYFFLHYKFDRYHKAKEDSALKKVEP